MNAEAYPGELAMLRGLVATLCAVTEHGDLADVVLLLDEHQRDEQDAYAEAATAPDFFQPGHTYSSTIFGGPFTVDYVGTEPGSGERYAHGWIHYEHDDSWAPNVVTGLFERFTDVTEAGDAR